MPSDLVVLVLYGRETVQTFRDYDDDLIERQQAIYDDEASMIESAQSAMAELESLFDEDIDKARKMDLSDFYDALKSQAIPIDEKENLNNGSNK